MNFVYTLPTRRRIDLDNPDYNFFHISEIAYALSRIRRFNGHTPSHYSVAQHSVLVCDQLPPELRLAGLLHDAAEAYIGDMTRNVKKKCQEFRDLEDKFCLAIASQFGFDYPFNNKIHAEDDRLCYTEAAQFFGLNEARTWGFRVKPYLFQIDCLDESAAEKLFLERFHSLD